MRLGNGLRRRRRRQRRSGGESEQKNEVSKRRNVSPRYAIAPFGRTLIFRAAAACVVVSGRRSAPPHVQMRQQSSNGNSNYRCRDLINHTQFFRFHRSPARLADANLLRHSIRISLTAACKYELRLGLRSKSSKPRRRASKRLPHQTLISAPCPPPPSANSRSVRTNRKIIHFSLLAINLHRTPALPRSAIVNSNAYCLPFVRSAVASSARYWRQCRSVHMITNGNERKGKIIQKQAAFG